MPAPRKSSFSKINHALMVAGVLVILAGELVSAVTVSAQRRPSRAGPDSPVAGAVLALLNQQRTKRGLRPLQRNPMLDEAAAFQSRDMVVHRYFEHQRRGGPGLVRRIRSTGYLRGAASWKVGENIAWAEAHLATPEHLVAGWMASHGHRANILDRAFRNIGIGVVPGEPKRHASLPALTITTDFGVRSSR
jgi:uncharacterized protein YkwD